MTPTEKLRAMLDERGVEWWPMHDVEVGYRQDRDTEFLVYGCKHVAHEWGCRLQVDMLTPEQAIAATLGAGTCKDVCSGVSEFTCSACGFNCDLTSWISLFDGDDGRHRHHHHGTPHYCPNCGRKVVDA